MLLYLRGDTAQNAPPHLAQEGSFGFREFTQMCPLEYGRTELTLASAQKRQNRIKREVRSVERRSNRSHGSQQS